jgi:hypothetical protein
MQVFDMVYLIETELFENVTFDKSKLRVIVGRKVTVPADREAELPRESLRHPKGFRVYI